MRKIFSIFSLLWAVQLIGQQPRDFVRLADLDSTFAFDMKYATTDNFLHTRAYECAECMVRYEVAQALVRANAYFKEKGYRIQFYDCYRPLDVQKAMWEIMPDARYVADPAKGSIHNRGGAVDITLVDEAGKALDMGTAFDYFGEAAHHAYQNLSAEVLANRRLLKTGMERFGFNAITTEWWHYNYSGAYQYEVSNFKVSCKH